MENSIANSAAPDNRAGPEGKAPKVPNGKEEKARESEIKKETANRTSVVELLKPYVKGKGRAFFFIVLSALAHTFLNVFAAYSLWKTVLAILDMTTDAGSASDAWWWASIAVISALLAVASYFLCLSISHHFAFETEKRIRLMASARALRKPLGFFMANDTGAIRKNVDANASVTHTFLAHQLPDIICNVTMPVFILIMIFWVDWKLALISMSSFILAMALFAIYMARNNDLTIEYFNSQQRMNAEAVEYVRGMAVVKTFGTDVNAFTNYRKAIGDYSKFVLSYTVSFRIPYVLLNTLVSVTGLILATWAALQIGWLDSDRVMTAQFGRNFILFALITPILNQMLMKISQVQYGEITRQSLQSIETLLSFDDFPKGTETCPPIESIEFDKVVFAYPSRPDRKILDGLDLKFERGKSYALVGSSGGGKSTIAALAARFWDVQDGAVLINGKNIKDYDLDSMYGRITTVLQRSGLLPGTLRDNLQAGNPEATDEQMIEAMKKASSEDILQKLPEGLDTHVDGHVHFSGGEIQRIGIARAMLKDSDVLILDEATSYADPENEHKIQLGFKELAKGRTLIMIAHRLNTVRGVDEILVIDEGRVLERGSHDELMAKEGGVYKEMLEDFQKSIRWSLTNKTAQMEEAK